MRRRYIIKLLQEQVRNKIVLCVLFVKAKIKEEFKEKTGPNMLGILQKHVKNGHINGLEV